MELEKLTEPEENISTNMSITREYAMLQELVWITLTGSKIPFST